MKKGLLLIAFVVCALWSQAQSFNYPLVRIADIQAVPATDLANCADASPLLGDTVRVRGVVLTTATANGIGLAQSASGRQIWIRDTAGTGPNNTVGVRWGGPNSPTSPDDILSAVAGDTVELIGVVEEFNGETQVNPHLSNAPGASTFAIVKPYGGGPGPLSNVLPIGTFNDANRVNNLTTGEAYEGEYVEFQNVTVTAVDVFSGGTRVSFDVVDQAGNKINVSDRYLVQRITQPQNSPYPGFIAPNVGDRFVHIRGVILHDRNCPGVGPGTRGYGVNPTKLSDYLRGAAGPSVLSLTRNRVNPTSSQTTTVTAVVTPGQNISGVPANLTNVTLFWATGTTGGLYTQAPMTRASGNNWTVDIPAQSNGTFIRYYVRAENDSARVVTIPNVPGGDCPRFFTVRDNGTTITDVQLTPCSGWNSGYVGETVTVEGVVTASPEATNLGFAYIQEPGAQTWGGVIVSAGTGVATMQVGQRVRVTGTVREQFNVTEINNVSSVTTLGTEPVPAPIDVHPDSLTNNRLFGERLEGMLVRLRVPSGNVFIVDSNVVAANQNQAVRHFGEYRIGADLGFPNIGTRILAGRQGGTSGFSSLNVSYLSRREPGTDCGTCAPLNVPRIPVNNGDQFASVTGIVWFSFGNFKVTPRNNADFVGYVAGFEEELKSKPFVVYPNPATGRVNLASSEEGTFTAVLTDLTGREVARQSFSGINGELSLAGLKVGMYQVSVLNKAGARRFTTKLSVY